MPPKKQKAPVIFESVTHPTLESVDPADAVKFLREREVYETEIAEREKDGTPIQPASFRVSMTPTFLRSVHAMGYFETISPDTPVEDLEDRDIKRFVESLAESAADDEPNASSIEEALKGLRTKMSIVNTHARVFQLALDYDMRMADIGCEKFRETNTKKAIELLTEHMHPPALRLQIKSDLEFIPKIRKNWRMFLNHAAKQAEHVQRGSDSAARLAKTASKADRKEDRRTPKNSKRPDNDQKSGGKSSSGPGKDSSNLPKCLSPDCQEFHFIKDCQNSSDERKKELTKQFREKKAAEKAAKSAKAVKKTDERDHELHSALFRACFAEKVEGILCADIGSDINLLPPSLLDELQKKSADIEVCKFARPKAYGLAVRENTDGASVSVICDKQVKMDVQLFIRHGSSLWLRNVVWYVATKEVPEPLLCRQLLFALGLDARKTLAAASILHKGDVDVEQLEYQDEELARGSVARLLDEQGLYHHSGAAVDAEHDHLPDSELGIDTPGEIETAFNNLINEAEQNGCPEPHRLRRLLEKHRSVFRCRLGNDPPALVEPMVVHLEPGTKPIMAKPRQYNKEQRKVIGDFVKRAVEFGFMRKNTNSSWSSAVLMVPKPKKEGRPLQYRVASDLRRINAVTIPLTWPLPNIESETSDFRGQKVFALLDFPSSYWQLETAYRSQELHSIVTPFGIFSPTRTTQGGRNSAANFQSKVEPCFAEIRDNLKAWLDDFILHARNFDQLLAVLDRFLSICASKRLKVSATKSSLFATSVKWCGRIVSEEGIKLDPRHLDGIANISDPQTASEVSQFIHCAQWMSSCIPDFATRVQPLRDIMEAAYTKAGRRTSKAISKIKLQEIAWGSTHADAMTSIQESLRNAVTLAHYDPEKSVCVFTDASDRHWAAAVTQCEKSELRKQPEHQQHKPLAFLGSEFKGAARDWSTIEKEGFAIFSTFKKMDYLFMGADDTHIYTDHRNLLYVFHPTSMEPGLGRHVVSKLQRWALFLSQFPYHIEHIQGEKNVMADMMTRWYRGYRGRKSPQMARRVMTRSSQENDANALGGPRKEEIRASQTENIALKPKKASEKDGILVVNGRVWIPPGAHDLQLSAMVHAHCGESGHRGSDATESIVKEQYTWDTVATDCRVFVNNCMHCITANSGEKIPRPLSITLHGNAPNDVLHFDFLYMGRSTDGPQYVLLLKDDFSSYCWLVPCISACAAETAAALSPWIRTFTAMRTWVSDQGSHFKNEVLRNLAYNHSIKHRFTIAYTPWANGTVERLCREVLRTVRSTLSEKKWAEEDWPQVINTVQSALNSAPVKRLGHRKDGTFRTPLEVMTGIQPNRGKQAMKFQTTEKSFQELQEAIEAVHRDVGERISKERRRACLAHNKKTNILPGNFSVGDYVMVRRTGKRMHKLAYKWIGPRRITEVLSNSSYIVQPLVSDKQETVHYSRLRLINGEKIREFWDLNEHATHTESLYDTVDSILTTRTVDGILYGHVRWYSPDGTDDLTWQPFEELCQDVPDIVRQYADESNDQDALEMLQKHESLNNQSTG